MVKCTTVSGGLQLQDLRRLIGQPCVGMFGIALSLHVLWFALDQNWHSCCNFEYAWRHIRELKSVTGIGITVVL